MTRSALIFSVLLFLSVTLFSTFVYANQTTVVNFMNSQHLLPEPERFTELYFTKHLELPVALVRNTQYTFPFTIHNLEHTPMTYTYVVTLTKNNEPSVIEEKQIFLDHDESETIEQTITTPDENIRINVKVTLKEKEQSIHFYTHVD